MRNSACPLFLLAPGLLLLTGCPSISKPVRRTILITYGESGVVEPIPGFAGFTRGITALRNEKKQEKPDLTIAAGNFMPPGAVMARQFIRLWSAASGEFDVCGVGPYELNNGPLILGEITKAPCLLASEVKGTQFPALKVLSLPQGGEIAVLTYVPNPRLAVADVALDPARPTLALAEARQKAGLILVLAYDIYRSQAIDLVNKHPEIDILFGQIRPDPATAQKPPARGRPGGTVESFGKSWVVDSGEVGIYRLTAEVQDGIVESLEARAVPVSASDPEPSDLAGPRDAYVADSKAMQIGEAPKLGGYSGERSCRICHQKEFDQWSRTGHAGALVTLLKTRDEYTPECLPCHSTGFGEPGGYQNFGSSAFLASVQCEACHGPALNHVFDAHKHRPLPPTVRGRIPTKETCLKCHTPKWSPKFDYTAARAAIHH